MKSIMYPYMLEEGMNDEWELKIHQSSHARYFEDFLKFVTYEQSMPEIVNEHVMGFVQNYVETKWYQMLPMRKDSKRNVIWSCGRYQ